MPYLSQLLDNKIMDSADTVIGRLEDILVMPKAGEYVPLEFLVVKIKGKKDFDYIPYEFVETFTSNEISLKFLTKKIPFQKVVDEKFLRLRKHVFDQQIVDLSGARVVRVNDLRIGNFDGDMCILGIDVSTKGLLRRLKMEWLDFFDVLKVHLIDWREAQPLQGSLKLDTVTDNLKHLHPADLANIIEDLNMNHRNNLVQSLGAQNAANVFEEVTPELQKILIKHWGPKKSSRILSQVSSDEIVDLMRTLPENEAHTFISYLKDTKVAKIEKLREYPDDTAGGLMTLDFINAKLDWTVSKTIKEIKKLSKTLRSIIYIYVTDENGVFCGPVSLRTLIISSPRKKLKNLVKDFSMNAVLKGDFKLDKIIEIMTKYNLYTCAVIDENNKLLGIVSIDDVMRSLFPHA